MRGIVALPGLVISQPGSISGKLPADERIWRTYALFFDKIIIPEVRSSGMLPRISLGTFAMLEQLGIVTRLLGDNDVPVLQTKLAIVRDTIFGEMEAAEPGRWAIATTRENEWVSAATESGRSFRVNLIRAIPVPDKDVPLEDLLQFKAKRNSELEALMTAVDGLYLEAQNAPDKPVAEMVATEKLLQAAKDEIKVLDEVGLRYFMGNLTADFNLTASAIAVGTSYVAGSAFAPIVGNGPLAAATIIASVVTGRLLRKKQPGTPYRYIASYSEELFV